MKLSLALIGVFLATAATGVVAQDDNGDASVTEVVEQALNSMNTKKGPSPWDWPDQPPVQAQVIELPSVALDDGTVSKRSLDGVNGAYLEAIAAKLATVDQSVGDNATAPAKRSWATGKYNLGNIVTKRDNVLTRRADYITLTGGTNAVYSKAALESSSYLTYKVISNTTSFADAKKACLAYCDSVRRCVTANMYQEYNNPLLDHVFSEKSNRKCALFAEKPTLSQLTNKGGQQLYGRDSPANYIRNSAVFYATAPLPVPRGYEYGYGPIDAALPQQPWGGIGWKILTAYDTQACADVCSMNRACKHFNIWQEMLDDDVKLIWCDLWGEYHTAADATFTQYQNSLITAGYSRGYNRKL